MKPLLLVEDDLIDIMSVKQSLADLNIQNPLVIARDGEAALQWLQDENNPDPCLMLLDLNMPRMSGFELLKALQAQQIRQHVPVVILTTSGHEDDRIHARTFNVAVYMMKPLDYEEFIELMKMLEPYWVI